VNLADAIRKAAYGGNFAPETPDAAPAEAYAPESAQKDQPTNTTMSNQNPHSEHQDQTMVRLELFLTPEQLSMLFKGVVATQHSVLTLREAANYLRINTSMLEQMAGHGELPAFQMNGRWRFPKAGLDEWLQFATSRKENKNAA
jgi:excisionase family DNA binding protein